MSSHLVPSRSCERVSPQARVWLENPVDAGDEDHPEHLVDREHAPLWLMPG